VLALELEALQRIRLEEPTRAPLHAHCRCSAQHRAQQLDVAQAIGLLAETRSA